MRMTGIMVFVAGFLTGCVTTQSIEDGLYSAAQCSVTTSIGCATQAIGGCIIPSIREPGDGWKNYAVCLWDKAKHCERAGLARCALAGAVEASGFPGLGGGSDRTGSLVLMGSRSNVPFRCDDSTVKACVTDARIETKIEAVRTVAYCYRHHCGGIK
jgi:hypothetical protein